MVKLATARESRRYGPRFLRQRFEYVSAGLYLFATILLTGGFVAQLHGPDGRSGLVLLLTGLALVAVVNIHDFVAHMVGIDCRWALMGFDAQLVLVEFTVPLVQTVGSILIFVAIHFFFFRMNRKHDYRLEKHALNLLIAGPCLWVIGSICNSCQIYERADGHVQILQKGVQIPFLMGSLLFLVGGVLNHHGPIELFHHGLQLLKRGWIWLSICGSLLLFIGGLMNVVKVFKMQQMGVRLEKLRGGAQERLIREREGQVPLILEEQGMRRKQMEDNPPQPKTVPMPTPYKDVLLGRSS